MLIEYTTIYTNREVKKGIQQYTYIDILISRLSIKMIIILPEKQSFQYY